MNDLIQSIVYALQFCEKKAILVTDKNIQQLPFPELLEELQDFIYSPEHKQLMITECHQMK